MTALSFGPVGWAAIVFGSLIVYGVVAVAVGRFAGSNESCVIDHGDDDTVWIPVLPPVPPSQPTVDLDDWVAGIPAEVLARAEMNRRFFGIVDAETRWFADGAA